MYSIGMANGGTYFHDYLLKVRQMMADWEEMIESVPLSNYGFQQVNTKCPIRGRPLMIWGRAKRKSRQKNVGGSFPGKN